MERTQAQAQPRAPQALYWIGESGPDGKPVAWLDGVPARDLTAADMAGLSDQQIRDALACGLYAETARKAVKPAASQE